MGSARANCHSCGWSSHRFGFRSSAAGLRTRRIREPHALYRTVSVVVAYPVLRAVVSAFIAALGDQVQELVGAVHHVDATCEGGICVEHVPIFVSIEHTDP